MGVIVGLFNGRNENVIFRFQEIRQETAADQGTGNPVFPQGSPQGQEAVFSQPLIPHQFSVINIVFLLSAQVDIGFLETDFLIIPSQ